MNAHKKARVESRRTRSRSFHQNPRPASECGGGRGIAHSIRRLVESGAAVVAIGAVASHGVVTAAGAQVTITSIAREASANNGGASLSTADPGPWAVSTGGSNANASQTSDVGELITTVSASASASKGMSFPEFVPEGVASTSLHLNFTVTGPVDFSLVGTLLGQFSSPVGTFGCCTQVSLTGPDGAILDQVVETTTGAPEPFGVGGSLAPGAYQLALTCTTNGGFGMSGGFATGAFTAMLEFTPTGPANDECLGATPIDAGVTPFATLDATTSGVPLDASCEEGFGLGFFNDVWFEYTARATGLGRVFTCGQANFDTRLAAYTGSCGDLSLVACNDDFPMCAGFTSQMAFPVVAGSTTLLRVGCYQPIVGEGLLTVVVESCPGDLDADGAVTGGDLGILLGAWGGCGGCPADLNLDGVVDGADLGALLGNWGGCR